MVWIRRSERKRENLFKVDDYLDVEKYMFVTAVSAVCGVATVRLLIDYCASDRTTVLHSVLL